MERRRFERVSQPFDGVWQGGSGNGRCRITDVGAGGCYVQSLAMPTPGESTVITVNIGERAITLSGRIAYIDPGMGFAVQFSELGADEQEGLRKLLETFNAENAQ